MACGLGDCKCVCVADATTALDNSLTAMDFQNMPEDGVTTAIIKSQSHQDVDNNLASGNDNNNDIQLVTTALALSKEYLTAICNKLQYHQDVGNNLASSNDQNNNDNLVKTALVLSKECLTAICDKFQSKQDVDNNLASGNLVKTTLVLTISNDLKTAKEDDPEWYCDLQMNKKPVDMRPRLSRRASFYIVKEDCDEPEKLDHMHAFYTDLQNPAVLKQIATGKMTPD